MKRIITLLTIALVASLLTSRLPAQQPQTFRVVVSSSNPLASLTRAQVSQLFLKKVTRWDHGGKVLPVDQLEKSATREAFSVRIHGRDVRAIKSYWQVQLFSGIATPPPELSTDAEVLSYVRSNANAIAYVSRNAAVGDGIKVLDVTG